MHICNVQSVDFSQRGPSHKILRFKSWVGFKCPGRVWCWPMECGSPAQECPNVNCGDLERSAPWHGLLGAGSLRHKDSKHSTCQSFHRPRLEPLDADSSSTDCEWEIKVCCCFEVCSVQSEWPRAHAPAPILLSPVSCPPSCSSDPGHVAATQSGGTGDISTNIMSYFLMQKSNHRR